MSIKLTKKQKLVYDFIADFISDRGFSPSYRDICAGLGLSSVSAVAEHVDNLIKLGALRKIPGAARSLEVVDYHFPETVNLFRLTMAQISDNLTESNRNEAENQLEILRKAANILNIDITEEN